MEIFLDGVWGTINRFGASSTDARVVCRQLGYNIYGKIMYGGKEGHLMQQLTSKV